MKNLAIILTTFSFIGCDHFPVRTDIKVSNQARSLDQAKIALAKRDWKNENCAELKKHPVNNSQQYSVLLAVTNDYSKMTCLSKVFNQEQIFAVIFQTDHKDQGYEIWKDGSGLSSSIAVAESDLSGIIFSR